MYYIICVYILHTTYVCTHYIAVHGHALMPDATFSGREAHFVPIAVVTLWTSICVCVNASFPHLPLLLGVNTLQEVYMLFVYVYNTWVEDGGVEGDFWFSFSLWLFHTFPYYWV